jgi:hypothetical protein
MGLSLVEPSGKPSTLVNTLIEAFSLGTRDQSKDLVKLCLASCPIETVRLRKKCVLFLKC